MIYLPGLNGIRAIASIAVVISHITLSLNDFGLNRFIFGAYSDGFPRSLDLAGYGVSMFFALSGFLITYLLWKEKEKQPIQIKKFYYRRILRIWPLYYVYLLCCVVVYFVFKIDFDKDLLPYYVFYGANIPYILETPLPLLIHFWSLGVEEQFYIFWPWINRLKKKKIMLFSFAVIVILIGLKTYLHIFNPNTILESIIHITRFHCMLIGALAAMLFIEKNALFIKFMSSIYTQIFAWLVFFIAAINKFHIASFLDQEFITFFTVVIIIGQISNRGIIKLETRVLDFLGKISYGVYVIHPLLIFLFSKVLKNLTDIEYVKYIIVYVIILISTILLSYISYRYLETPFLRYKIKKYAVIQSSNSKE